MRCELVGTGQDISTTRDQGGCWRSAPSLRLPSSSVTVDRVSPLLPSMSHLQALMTDRQRRVMLKLFAVSAFLNHRDFRDSSTASVLRLREETNRIFSRPLTADSRACLKTVCMQVSDRMVAAAAIGQSFFRGAGARETQENGLLLAFYEPVETTPSGVLRSSSHYLQIQRVAHSVLRQTEPGRG